MNKIRVFMAFVVIACFTCSCDREMQNYDSNRQGSVKFQIENKSATNKMNTRIAGEVNVENFSLSLKKGNETIGFWEKFGNYQDGTLFPFGTYSAIASYGDIAEEGWSKPFYSGESPFTINSSTNPVNVNITCTLANAKMTVSYTDAFKSYFSAFHAVNVVSSLGSTFDFEGKSEGELYLTPGKIDVYATVKKQNSTDNIRLQIKKGYEIKAKQHYRLNLDVDAGSSKLVITFTEDVEEAILEFNISDEELNKLAPNVVCGGFESNHTYEIIEGINLAQSHFFLTAQSGIASCILNTNSLSLISRGWPETIDLMAPTIETLNLMKTFDFKIKGFDGACDMAVVDLAGVIPYITYNAENPISTFTLTATDKIGRVTTSVANLMIKTVESNNSFTLPSLLAFASQSIEATIKTSLSNDKLSFFYWENSVWKPLNVSEIIDEGDNIYTYIFKLDNPLITPKENIRMKVLFNKIEREASTLVDDPFFTLGSVSEGAIWAKSATFKITKETITRAFDINNVRIEYKDGNEWITPSQSIDGDKINVTNLLPSHTYIFRAIYNNGMNLSVPLQSLPITITTESLLQIPNADMNDWDIENSRDLAKDKWSGLSKTTYHAYRPQNHLWSTTNSKTFNHGSGYCINAYASVISDDRGTGNKAALIRSIGWNTGSGNTYGGITGNTCAERSAGKLFLGNYSFDSGAKTDTYNYGIPFTSRPKNISFEYKYNKFGRDNFKVWAVVENRSGNVVKRLAYGEVAAGDNADTYTQMNFDLVYDQAFKDLKATHFYLVFSSSNKCHDEHAQETILMNNPRIMGVVGNSYWGGSILCIDNIHLNY